MWHQNPSTVRRRRLELNWVTSRGLGFPTPADSRQLAQVERRGSEPGWDRGKMANRMGKLAKLGRDVNGLGTGFLKRIKAIPTHAKRGVSWRACKLHACVDMRFSTQLPPSFCGSRGEGRSEIISHLLQLRWLGLEAGPISSLLCENPNWNQLLLQLNSLVFQAVCHFSLLLTDVSLLASRAPNASSARFSSGPK